MRFLVIGDSNLRDAQGFLEQDKLLKFLSVISLSEIFFDFQFFLVIKLF